eukprot:1159388-Pelagomonas_calceolata.AAC.13
MSASSIATAIQSEHTVDTEGTMGSAATEQLNISCPAVGVVRAVVGCPAAAALLPKEGQPKTRGSRVGALKDKKEMYTPAKRPRYWLVALNIKVLTLDPKISNN